MRATIGGRAVRATAPIGGATKRMIAAIGGRRIQTMAFIGGRRVLLASRAFAPTDLSGLKLWLKADSLSLNDGDPVSTWADQSGNGHHATQGTGSRQPTLQLAEINGLAAVLGDGTDDHLNTTYATVVENGVLCAIVLKPVALDAEVALGAWNELGTARVQIVTSATGVFTVRIHDGGNAGLDWIGRETDAGALVAGTPDIWTFTYDGGTTASGIKIYKNGVQADTTDANSGTYTVPSGGGDVLVVLAQAGGVAAVNAHLAEVTWYNPLPSVAAHNQLGIYLAARYGKTWTTVT